MDILGRRLVSSIQDVRNVADEENDYVPECDSKTFLSPDHKQEIVLIYNLVIAEEGHSPSLFLLLFLLSYFLFLFYLRRGWEGRRYGSLSQV